MATTSADVPGLYDLVVAVSGGNTTGFLLNDSLESSIPFRTHRAIYSYTPTFIERQNVSGDFGDNQQDFFLTATQRDWSLGEQQRYFHQSDSNAARRYWTGSGIDISLAGKVSLRPAVRTETFAASVSAVGPYLDGSIAVATSTNLYAYIVNPITGVTTITDEGAHGLGAAPSSVTTDQKNVYLSTTTAGTVGVRKWTGSAFSTFSATGVDSLAYLNNTLYGMSLSGNLYRFDTAGLATSLFTWKDAAGVAITNTAAKLAPFGGKLTILRFVVNAAELWLYDGSGVSLLARMPPGFTAKDVCEANGNLYISGAYSSECEVILVYSAGSLVELWRSKDLTTPSTPVIAFEKGIVFQAEGRTLAYYNADTGGVSTIGAAGSFPGLPGLAADPSGFLIAGGQTTAYFYSGFLSTVSSGSVSTSLFDFDSSLTKFFRGITVEFDAASDGNHGSVDIGYQIDSVDGSYTSLATGVTSGAENLFGSSVTGKRISVQVTLNKGTSTSGPVLKRISVRAAPILTRYKQREYILNCAGDPSIEDAMALRDDANSTHPLAGRQQVNELVLAAASQTPLTLTDRFGNYTGIIEVLEAYEQHPSNADPSRSGSFLVKLGTREV